MSHIRKVQALEIDVNVKKNGLIIKLLYFKRKFTFYE